MYCHNDYMQWETLSSGSEWNAKHSTPLSFRPPPTASPNVSKFLTNIEEEVLKLAEKLAQLKLD